MHKRYVRWSIKIRGASLEIGWILYFKFRSYVFASNSTLSHPLALPTTNSWVDNMSIIGCGYFFDYAISNAYLLSGLQQENSACEIKDFLHPRA